MLIGLHLDVFSSVLLILIYNSDLGPTCIQLHLTASITQQKLNSLIPQPAADELIGTTTLCVVSLEIAK